MPATPSMLPNPTPPASSSRRAERDGRQPATALIDESVHRLRLAPRGTLTIYYAGTLPFILALLYFWADQGHSPDAEAHGSSAALGLALLFALMKICQAVFAAQLSASIRRRPGAPWTWARLGRLALVQTALQPSGLFVLSVAAVLTVPLGWVYAFYQNVTVLGDGETPSIRAVFSRACRHALRQPGQNHAGLSVLSILAFFAWINLMTIGFLLPRLAHMFTGEENLFTRSGAHFLFNSTFFAVTGSLVYLALDPLAKTFYALRCFYADSRRTGEDLRSELAALPPVAGGVPALAVLAALGLLLLPGGRVQAADAAPVPSAIAVTPPPVPAAPGSVSPPALGRSIDDVLRRREFAWRAPRQADPAQKKGAVDSFFDNCDRWWKERQAAMSRWFNPLLKRLGDWLQPRGPRKLDEPAAPGASGGTLELLLYAMIAVLAALLGVLGWRLWQGVRSGRVEGKAAPAAATGPTPDLTDDSLLASQLPEDEWLQLARKLAAGGDRRLALRAFYLSVLAGLGERGLLAIARHKSNRDYVLELRRRARDRAEVAGAFARNVGRFERVWYGEHPADDGLLADFQADREIVLR